MDVNVLLSIFVAYLLAAGLQFLLWRHAVKSANAGWVDLGWTLGMAFGMMSAQAFLPFSPRGVFVGGVVLFWSLRLAAHIYVDRLRGENPEDGRYVNLRGHWGEQADRKFFFFFQGQALLVPIFMLPPIAVILRPGAFPDVFDLLGLLIAFGAIAGESLADRQLARFRQNPENKGKVCQSGLWRYSRHPNYFCEWLHWTSYVLWSMGSPLAPLAWIGMILMYLFLRYLTGIPHTERQSLQSRGEAYRTYQQTTNVFFPWIPQKPS